MPLIRRSSAKFDGAKQLAGFLLSANFATQERTFYSLFP
jgi:hypothetical protein